VRTVVKTVSGSEPPRLRALPPDPAGSSRAKQEVDATSRIPAAPIRVSVLRFDPLRASGLQSLFEDNAAIEIVLESGTHPSGSGWPAANADVVLVGAHLGAGTNKLIASIRAGRPELPILVMSPAAGDNAILSVLKLGAKGFLHESASAAQVEEAVRAAVHGSIWAPRRILSELVGRLLSASDTARPIAEVKFTVREQQVLNLLLDGRPNREIAQILKIEERTVKSYVTRLLRKMGVKNRTALSMLAASSRPR